ncbi:MAG: hypothetical protein WKF82_02160 [Nocardioidaceae bacterium]
MTEIGIGAASIAAAIANLRTSGYRVFSGPAAESVAPEWLKRLQPDIIAQRDEEFLVLEVKSRRPASPSPKLGQLTELASEISKHPGWALELVWLGDEEPQGRSADVDNLITRADRVLQVDVEAALLLVWPAVETGLQLLASRVGVREASAKQLLSELYSLGWLSERHFNELDDAQVLRNSIAHRVGGDRVDPAVVLRLAQIARRLADPSYISVDRMVEWFRSNYMEPANGVPYDSREGGYIYISGGPYDALEVLSEQYPDALPDELEDATEILEHESDAWVRHDEY